VWKLVILLILIYVLQTTDKKTSTSPKKHTKPEVQLPVLELPQINNETTKNISKGKWQEAGRQVFFEAVNIYPRGTDTVRNQALSGYIEDALLALPNLSPDAQSWVLYSAAHELRKIEQGRRVAMFRQAAEAVRAKKLPANIRADAFAHAAIGLLEQGKTDEAISVMQEAFQSAINGPNEEERGAALRILADDLETASWINVSPLLPVAEEAARLPAEPFHQAFAHASLARIWYRLGDEKRAWQWWQDGMAKAATISRENSKTTAENGLAEVSAEMGNRQLADTLIADRKGPFVDVLVNKVMVIEAKKKNYADALGYFSAIKAGCASSSATGGFALRQVVEVQAKNGDIDPARKTSTLLAGCAPRFNGEAWLDIADAQLQLKNRTAAYQSVQSAIAPIKAITNRPIDKFELLVLVRSGEILARSGLKSEGIAKVAEAVAGIHKLSSRYIEDKVPVAVEASKVFAKYGSREKAIEAMMLAYQLASHSPKEGLVPEMDKARSLTRVGRALAGTKLK
jgi:tetratricopeptide (TPR) repeat protein